jgi:hydroxymethylglutaryl-CoA lyase
MDKLLAATNVMSGVLGKPPVSRVASALNARRKRAAS